LLLDAAALASIDADDETGGWRVYPVKAATTGQASVVGSNVIIT